MKTKRLNALLIIIAISSCSSSIGAECLSVQKRMADTIMGEDQKRLWDTSHAKAVKSNDFSKLFFISMRTKADKSIVGVWASNSLTPGGGMIFAINYVAIDSTPWPVGSKSRASVRMGDHGSYESIDCSE